MNWSEDDWIKAGMKVAAIIAVAGFAAISGLIWLINNVSISFS